MKSSSHNQELSETNQRKKIRNMFNSIAGTYDLLNHLLSFGIDHHWRKKTIQAINISHDSKILDLATGTGDLAAQALKKKPTFIIGADPSYFMLYKTKNKLKKNFNSYKKDSRFYGVETFGEFLPFKSESFTHAMIAYGIRNVSNRDLVFSEIYRVLQREGIFAILEFSKSPYPLFAAFYSFYFHKLLPFVGGLLSGNREAYHYLPQSVKNFASAEILSKELEENGFEKKIIRPMFFGITTLFVFEKVVSR